MKILIPNVALLFSVQTEDFGANFRDVGCPTNMQKWKKNVVKGSVKFRMNHFKSKLFWCHASPSAKWLFLIQIYEYSLGIYIKYTPFIHAKWN